MLRREPIGKNHLVAFDDRGEGPAVVLLHPFPFDGRIWLDNRQALNDAGFRTIVVDSPGYGDSPVPVEPASIAGVAEMVIALLDRLEIERAALVGLSMGGYVALALVHLAPRRLWALVLADTRAAADGAAARQGRADALRAIKEKSVDGYLRQSLPKLLTPAASPELLQKVLGLAEKREQTLNAGVAALRDRPDRSGALRAITCPTLVLVGAGDGITTPAEMRELAAEIPGATFVELPGAGHLANLEQPRLFEEAVIEFLRGAAVAAPTAGGQPGARPSIASQSAAGRTSDGGK